ncbi:3'-5' exonuclease [Galbibacter mesophilus]|uniref:3'-5' exonuclease n=1 Tax=Galbibacter mesophilus TaxID=379069 RepID=UPI00191ED42D|nr:3'-5' exonuclease [Galbibacter mesophilus]MCM5661352.1 3'-5' exonuclease [Galbibacter mesophilus]
MEWFKFFKKAPPNYPQFWKDYEQQFETGLPESIHDTRFVVLDTETTGFNFITDRMLCIGAISLKNNQMKVSDAFEVYINQEQFNPETVKIHGIINNSSEKRLSEEEAVKKFLAYIGNSVLVAHHAHFDIEMINCALERIGLPVLKNKVLDTMVLYRATRIKSNLLNREKQYSLDEIAENLNISVKDRHTAAGDAMITAIAFLKIINKLFTKENSKLKHLFKIS